MYLRTSCTLNRTKFANFVNVFSTIYVISILALVFSIYHNIYIYIYILTIKSQVFSLKENKLIRLYSFSPEIIILGPRIMKRQKTKPMLMPKDIVIHFSVKKRQNPGTGESMHIAHLVSCTLCIVYFKKCGTLYLFSISNYLQIFVSLDCAQCIVNSERWHLDLDIG